MPNLEKTQRIRKLKRIIETYWTKPSLKTRSVRAGPSVIQAAPPLSPPPKNFGFALDPIRFPGAASLT